MQFGTLKIMMAEQLRVETEMSQVHGAKQGKCWEPVRTGAETKGGIG